MSENHEGEPAVFPAEKVEIIPASEWYQQVPTPPSPPPRSRRIRLPLLLFIATCLSTLMAGLSISEINTNYWPAINHALMYAVPVMLILVFHEMGHFLQARRHGVYCSWPYFIPMPFSPIGTMGAVIAMQARMGHRRALFDIGVSGPLAGLVPTLICCVLGIYWSQPVLGRGELGDPLLFKILLHLMGKHIPAGCDLLLHPVAFAGWVGLLITSLNLIPIGQLDGGHVLYALLGKKAHIVAQILLLTAVFAVVFYGLFPWLLMIFLLIMMGPAHPPTADDEEPLGWWRYLLGWLTLAFIPFGFMPMPFNIGP